MFEDRLRRLFVLFPYVLLLCNFGAYTIGFLINHTAGWLGISRVSLTIESTLKIALVFTFILIAIPAGRRYFYRMIQQAFAEN